MLKPASLVLRGFPVDQDRDGGNDRIFGRDDRQKALAVAGDVVLLFSAESGIAKNASAEQHDRSAGLNRVAAFGKLFSST